MNTFESLVLKSLNSKYSNYLRNLINAYENEKANIDMTVLLSMAGPKTQNKCNSTASNKDDAIYFQTKIGLEKCLQYFMADLEYNLLVARSVIIYIINKFIYCIYFHLYNFSFNVVGITISTNQKDIESL